jgi:hypothetical protein
MLCGFSHNDLSVLAMRHQGDEGVIYMAPIAPEVLQGIFFLAIFTVVVAAEPLRTLAGFPGNPPQAHSARQELFRCRAETPLALPTLSTWPARSACRPASLLWLSPFPTFDNPN